LLVLRQKVLYAHRVGGQAISVQDKNTENTQANRRKKRWFMHWAILGSWKWILSWFLIMFVVALSVGLWAWTQRYALMEGLVIDSLAESGFDTELDIVSVSRTQAQVRNIRLRRGDKEFLRIDTMRADYVWPDVRTGKLKALELDGATGRLSLDDNWQPSESWIQSLLASGDDNRRTRTSRFPENGVGLTDSTLILNSPLGEATLFIDGQALSEKDFNAEITLAPSDLSYGGYAAKGAGVVTLEKAGPNLRLIGQTQTEVLSNDKLDVSDAHLQFDGTMDLDALSYTGGISLESERLSSDLLASGPARLGWDGIVSLKDGVKAKGTWIVSAKDARSPRRARAAEVAETLSLFPALSKVPVTENYAPAMRSTVEDFILGSDVAGQGQLNYESGGFTINPVGPLSIKSSKNKLVLHPQADENFYIFDRANNQISARMNAVFDKPVGLTLTDIQLKAASGNGIRLNGIQTFSARVDTQANWRTKDEDGRPVRLGPLNASLQYNSAETPRRLSVETALDYDGDLPGGYVNDLNLDGRLDVRLYETRQVLDFTPKRGQLITIKSLDTSTNWQGEDISFTLPATANLFTRTSQSSVLTATLNSADFTLTQAANNEATSQRLEIESGVMTLSGTLFPDAVQRWVVDFTDVKYASDSLPGPRTTASAATANLTAKLSSGQPPQITFDSPSVTAETPFVALKNIGISVTGMPDNYQINHTSGTIDVIGTEFAATAKAAGLASFPANGAVNFVEGLFRGTAKLRIAKANNASVNVDYTYKNGAGTAEIDIPSILFAPKGLQPQTLFPAFRGKVARVEGEARAKLNLSFSQGAITRSSGTVQLVDMALGTAPGPIAGLDTTLSFASIFPLQTDGLQTLTMKNFNPGFPLEDGVMSFSLIPDGVEVASADWPIGNGSFALDPFTWLYAAKENRVTMRVKDIALSDFLNNLGNQRIEATGNVVGVFPIVVRGIDVLIEKGRLSVPNGGVIKYDPGPGAPTYTEEEAIAILRERRTAEYASLAQDALREFRYRELSASLDGPINGDVEIGMVFDGSNQKVLNRQPFRFDMTVKGELFNIARSFNSNAQVKSEILRQNGKLPQGTIIGN